VAVTSCLSATAQYLGPPADIPRFVVECLWAEQSGRLDSRPEEVVALCDALALIILSSCPFFCICLQPNQSGRFSGRPSLPFFPSQSPSCIMYARIILRMCLILPAHHDLFFLLSCTFSSFTSHNRMILNLPGRGSHVDGVGGFG
jgi:hypothetical protein